MPEFNIFQVEKPWGNFRQFTHNEVATIKILSLDPHTALSLQYHEHRAEFWKVLVGQPIVTIGENIIQAKVGDEFKIAKLEKHRLEARDDQVQILEIVYGHNFDEEDIVRLEDKYGRT